MTTVRIFYAVCHKFRGSSIKYVLFKGLIVIRACVIPCSKLHVYFLFIVSACGFGNSLLERS